MFESIRVKMPDFWKSHVVTLILNAKCDRVTECVVAKADTRAVSSLNTVGHMLCHGASYFLGHTTGTCNWIV